MNDQEAKNTISQEPSSPAAPSSPASGPRNSALSPNSAATSPKKNLMARPGAAREDELDEYAVSEGIKTGASTVAGAGLGVIAGIAGIVAAAAIEIVLPVSLCLWATGVSGGALGLVLGLNKKRKC